MRLTRNLSSLWTENRAFITPLGEMDYMVTKSEGPYGTVHWLIGCMDKLPNRNSLTNLFTGRMSLANKAEGERICM